MINDFRWSFDLYGFKIDDRKKVEEFFEFYIESNPNIVKDWSKKTNSTQSIIRDFWKIYGWHLIKEYNLSFKPYDLIKEYGSDIENTINCKQIEMTKKYTAETDWTIYCIRDKAPTSTNCSIYYVKKVIVNDNWHKKHLLLASRDFMWPYTLYKWCEVVSRKDLFWSVRTQNPEIFDSLFDIQTVNDTKNRIKQWNFALNDIENRKNYQKERKWMGCTVYSQDNINTKIYKNIEQCLQETIKFHTHKMEIRNIRIWKECYRLLKITIWSKEYLLAGEYKGVLSIGMLKKIDKKYLDLQEQTAYDNSVNIWLNISWHYFENDLYNFYLNIFRSNYNFDFFGRNWDINYSEINIKWEPFSVCSINCWSEGNLLFAAKWKEGVYTLENWKIVAEYLKKFKDLQKKDI